MAGFYDQHGNWIPQRETSLAADLALAQEASYQAGLSHPTEETAEQLALRGCAYARDLAAGQTIYEGGAILGEDDQFMIIEQRPVTVVRGPEPAADFFDRDGHFKWWCLDQLSGRQGWLSFGPGGVVRVETMLPYAPLAAEAAEHAAQLAAWDTDGGH